MMQFYRNFLKVIVWIFHMLDPRLQTLRMLAARGTVTAAAEALHLTPSTVSQQLRGLARDLGVRLLEAEGRRVRLTAAAQTLLEHVDVLHADVERAESALAAHREGTVGTLRLCGVSSAVANLLVPAALALQSSHPGITVQMSEEESDDCFPQLLSHHADIAVLIPSPLSPPPDDSRFEQHPLIDEPQDLLVATNHRFASRRRIRLDEATDEAWIADPDRVDQYQLLLAAAAAAGFSPRITHHAKEWFAVSSLVAHGFGVCLIPRLAPVPADHAVVRIPLHGHTLPTRRIITCIRRGSRDQPMIAAGLDALAQVRHRQGDHPRTHERR